MNNTYPNIYAEQASYEYNKHNFTFTEDNHILSLWNWEKADIEETLEELNIKYTNYFIDKILFTLYNKFDAEYGINWTVIRETIFNIIEEQKEII